MKNKKSKTGFLVLAVLLCLGIVWVCTITGAASVSISDANRILLNKLFHLNVSLEEISKGNITIIWNIRFPRIILGFITGAALAVSGARIPGHFQKSNGRSLCAGHLIRSRFGRCCRNRMPFYISHRRV